MENNALPAQDGDQRQMAVSPKSAIALLVYYILLIGLFGVWSAIIFSTRNQDDEMITIKFSVFLSIVGSGIFYSRKLYKACISNTYNSRDGTSMQMIGTLAFFYLRPVFAAVFCFIINIIWIATIKSSVTNFQEFSETHFYISGSIGFFIGFLAGRVLTKMEVSGENYLAGVR